MARVKAFAGKVLATLFTAEMLTSPVASAPARGSALVAEESVTPEDNVKLCILAAFSHGTIAIGHGEQRIEIELMGGACEPPGSGISSLWARYPENSSALDVVRANNCPAYKAKIDELWAAKRRHVRGQRPSKSQVGPFVIHNSGDLFTLNNSKGRKAATRWIRDTLVEVRPCWNTFRDDQTREVVDDLYRRLSIPLPAAHITAENSEGMSDRD